MDTKGGKPRGSGGGGVMNWEIGIDMYTLMCIKWMTNKNLQYKKIKFKKKVSAIVIIKKPQKTQQLLCSQHFCLRLLPSPSPQSGLRAHQPQWSTALDSLLPHATPTILLLSHSTPLPAAHLSQPFSSRWFLMFIKQIQPCIITNW